jgi:hypothetical protein
MSLQNLLFVIFGLILSSTFSLTGIYVYSQREGFIGKGHHPIRVSGLSAVILGLSSAIGGILFGCGLSLAIIFDNKDFVLIGGIGMGMMVFGAILSLFIRFIRFIFGIDDEEQAYIEQEMFFRAEMKRLHPHSKDPNYHWVQDIPNEDNSVIYQSKDTRKNIVPMKRRGDI